MLNKVCLIGRITKDPYLNVSIKGVSNLSFILAVEDFSKGEKEVSYIPCGAILNIAEYISKYITKGSLICVSGKLKSNNYEDIQTGKIRSTIEVMVETVDLLSRPLSQNKELEVNQIEKQIEKSSIF